MHLKEATRTFKGTTIPWLCDNPANDLKTALGGLNNPEFVFDREGKIVRLRDWSSPAELRADLEQLVGPVAKPTRVEDLELRFENPPRVAAHGIVPRIDVPERMHPVKATPKDDGKYPYYAKLRAEGDDGLLQTGTGKLYLGFHLDRLYNVHWNNLVAPIGYEITGGDGTTISPASGKGPKVETDADVDPREFLLEIEGGNPKKILELTIRYFACNDEEGWCKSVTQSYVIHLERDRDAGVVRAREWGGRGPGGRFRGARVDGPPSVDTVFERFDADKDGKLSASEIPEFVGQFILPADSNKDGSVTKEELEEHRGSGTGRPGGNRSGE
jgi:hypothetical protein